MKWLLSIIMLLGFVRGLYYIFIEAKDETVILKIASFLFNMINLFAFLFLTDIFNYKYYVSAEYGYVYVLICTGLLLYAGQNIQKNNKNKYIKEVLKIVCLILLYGILEYVFRNL